MVHSGAVVDGSELSLAEKCAFARVAGSAERGAAPSAVFEVQWCFSWRLAGVLCLVVAAAFDVPDFVWRLAGLAVVDISGPSQACHWLALCTCGAELHWRDCWSWHLQRCCLRDELHSQVLSVREPWMWR